MELLDRYLQSVGRHLPAARKADILAELRANLEAQLEEREDQLGRPLTPAEAEAWIKSLGSPVRMAARYQPEQSLIGPALFPIYWYSLRLVFFWSTAIYLIVSGVLLALNGPTAAAVAEAIFRLPATWFTTAAWVTLIFAALEIAARRSPHFHSHLEESIGKFDPAPISALDPDPAPAPRRRSYPKAAAEFIFQVLLVGWLLLIPANPFLLMGPGIYYYQSLPYRIGPVVEHVYWAIVLLNVVQAAWAGINLSTGAWQRPRIPERLAAKALGFVPLGLLLAAPQHLVVVLRDPALDEARLGSTLYTINEAVHTTLTVVLVIAILQFAWDAVRLFRTASSPTV